MTVCSPSSRRPYRSAFFVAVFVAVAANFAMADEDGWVELFDGETLEGWTQRNGEAVYRVQDGRIMGTTSVGSPNSFLCSNKEYGDFELTFDVKCDGALNSGVQIRSQTKDGPTGRVNGPQVEIEASGEGGAEAGYIYGEATVGWITPEEKRQPHKNFKDGRWNTYRVIAKGPKIQVWINDEMVTDISSQPNFETHPKGFIGLQVHGIGKDQGPFDVSWRNIRIRELSE